MAKVRFTLTGPAAGISIAVATAVTCLQATAPTNQDIYLDEVVFGFVGLTNTDEPLIAAIYSQTSAGTTPAGSCNAFKVSASNVTVQTTGKYGPYATDPMTSGTNNLLWNSSCHPQWNGGIEFPLTRSIYCGGGTKLALVVTKLNGANNTVFPTLTFEE